MIQVQYLDEPSDARNVVAVERGDGEEPHSGGGVLEGVDVAEELHLNGQPQSPADAAQRIEERKPAGDPPVGVAE